MVLKDFTRLNILTLLFFLRVCRNGCNIAICFREFTNLELTEGGKGMGFKEI